MNDVDNTGDGGSNPHPLTPLTESELVELKANDPDAWWTTVIWGPGATQHSKRCPSCSELGVRVGSNFRAPSKGDDKAWAEIQRMIDDGGKDMTAEFEFCPTVEEWEEMKAEASRRKERMAKEEDWVREKKRRIAALGLRAG